MTTPPPRPKTIRQLRTEHGLSQPQLATRLRVTPGTVSGWETGRRRPDAARLRALAAVFGIGADEIALVDRRPASSPTLRRPVSAKDA
jgi:transcriptional regulator with XRE-family HTH domain